MYLLVGILRFIPPLIPGSAPGAISPFTGFLLVYRNYSGSKAYALALGIVYTALFLLGILSGSVATLGGLVLLNGVNHILPILTALAAFGACFASLDTVDVRRVPSAQG